jgi:hypothetical protein
MNFLLDLLIALVGVSAIFVVSTAISWLIMKVVNYEVDKEMREMKLRQ